VLRSQIFRHILTENVIRARTAHTSVEMIMEKEVYRKCIGQLEPIDFPALILICQQSLDVIN
jgi:hypothetical protein